MKRYISAARCVGKTNNKFDVVLLAAKRVSQLDSGFTSLVERHGHKNTIVAINEIMEGKITPDNIDTVGVEHNANAEFI